MKSLNYIFVLILVLGILTGASNAQNSISGNVRFSDNNELVTEGVIKAYTSSGSLLNQVNINPNGSYEVVNLPEGETDLLGFPNIEPEEDNFFPAFYPGVQDWHYATVVNCIGNVSNIDIYVDRAPLGGGLPNGASISGLVVNNNTPVKEAIVYLKSLDYKDITYTLTNNDGSFNISGIIEGDYVLVVHRISYASIEHKIHVSKDNTGKINLNIKKETQNILKSTAPIEFNLSQNYPNPFNPATTIKYKISNNGFVTLKVYNAIGKEVSVLVNENQVAGTYEIKFNAVSLTSGIYFYTLSSVNFTETKKMVLIK